MLQAVHMQMMHLALDGLVSARALDMMISANLGVDALWNQFGRHELHFDANAFEPSYRYLDKQRALVRPALEAGKSELAWRAFGRLTHTAQDFYSHSNYVDLWIVSHPPGRVPPAPSIEPLDEAVIRSPALRSGKVNLPVEALCYVPLVGPWIRKLAPHDSHAQMNLDSSARGPMFEYAFHGAVKRTRAEYEAVARALPADLLARFRDLPS